MKAEWKQILQLQQKKHRDATGLFVAEGDKCIGELRPFFRLECLLTPENTPLPDIQRLSSLRTPQGSIAVFRKPVYDISEVDFSGLVLALDDIQDPGNLGTILRTCDWFGVRDVICSAHTADCFSPKVVQATMGALARVRVHYLDNLAEYLRQRKSVCSDLHIYGTVLGGTNLYEKDAIPDSRRGILVMGNEGNGISAGVQAVLDRRLFIPPYRTGCVESLNVAIATAVTLAFFRQKQ